MQAIKALVIGMGVLIVAGMIVLVYGVTTKFGKTSPASKTPDVGEVNVTLPPGSEVLDARLDGGTLVVRVRDGAGVTRVILFRREDGRRVGSFRFEAPAR